MRFTSFSGSRETALGTRSKYWVHPSCHVLLLLVSTIDKDSVDKDEIGNILSVRLGSFSSLPLATDAALLIIQMILL